MLSCGVNIALHEEALRQEEAILLDTEPLLAASCHLLTFMLEARGNPNSH